MTAQRKRRVQPLRKPSVPPRRRKTKQIRKTKTARKPIRIQDAGMKMLIVLFFCANMVLIIFAVRQCSKSHTVTDAVQETEHKEEEVLEPIQIEVLNGCGVTGVAARFTDYLRANDIDVVRTDNYETFNVLKTVVVDRRGRIKSGIRVAKILGLGEERVLQEVNEAYLVDVTLILGKDYRQLDSWNNLEILHVQP
jgi:hypothetical protein